MSDSRYKDHNTRIILNITRTAIEDILNTPNLIFLTAILVLSLFTASSDVRLYAQESYPDNIFASTNQAQLHELALKATQENGQTNTVAGFKVDLTNVVSTPANSELAIFTTDNALSVLEAKVKSTDTFTYLIKKNANVFSLTGLPSGVYTLDVIIQKQGGKAAYEGIIVIGQPVDQATQQAVQKEIVKQETNVNIFEKPKQQPEQAAAKQPKQAAAQPCTALMTLGCPPGDGLSNQPPVEYCDDFNGDGFCDITYLADGSTIIENQKAIGALKSSNTECDPDRDDNCVTGVGDSKETATGERKYNPDGAHICGNDETGEEWPCGPDIEAELSCQPEDDFCEPGCESPTMDCIDDVNVGDDGEDLSCQPEDDFCEPGCESPTMDCIDDVNVGDDGEDSVPDEDEEVEEESFEEEEESFEEEEESFEDTGAEDEE